MDIQWLPRMTGCPDTDIWARVNGCDCIVYFYGERWWFRVEVGKRYVCEVVTNADAAKTAALGWAKLGADAVSAAFIDREEAKINRDIKDYVAACPERREAFAPGYSVGFHEGQQALIKAMLAHVGLDEVRL